MDAGRQRRAVMAYLRRMGERGASRNMVLMHVDELLPDGVELDDAAALVTIDCLLFLKRAQEHQGRLYPLGTARLRDVTRSELARLGADLVRASTGHETATIDDAFAGLRRAQDLLDQIPRALATIRGDYGPEATQLRKTAADMTEEGRRALQAWHQTFGERIGEERARREELAA